MIARVRPLAFFAVLLLSLLLSACQGDLDVDREALLALYDSTQGDDWTNNTGWANNADDIGGWYGVTLDKNASVVTELLLFSNNLRGTIAPELGNLTGVLALDLNTNFLTGSIPAELSKMTTLQQFSVSQNRLSGSLPPEFGRLENLVDLFLYDNDLTGEIPKEIGNLTLLDTLSARDNDFSGNIPAEMGNLTSLQFLALSGSLLTGPIPESIGGLATHYSLNGAILLQDNYLTGSVPSGISTTNILEVDLSNNLLNDWPDQRNGSATAPPVPSESTPAPTAAAAADDTNSGGASSPSSSSKSRSSFSVAAIAGVSVAAAAVIGVLACLLWRRRTRRKNGPVKSRSRSHHQTYAVQPSAGGLGYDYGDEEDGGESKTTGQHSRGSSSGITAPGSANNTGQANASGKTEELRLPSYTDAAAWRGDQKKGKPAPSAVLPRYGCNPDEDPNPSRSNAEKRNYSENANSSRSRSGGGGSGVSGVGGSLGSIGGTMRDGEGSSMLSLAAAVMAAAESLAQQSFIPGVREAATVVSGLVGLAADHKSNAGDMEKRVRWCRSIVLTLERAGKVLGKAKGRDAEAERILLEDVQDSIQDMAQIMESYKSKNMVSKVFVSTLCKRRQEQAEADINSAVQRLQLVMQVRVGTDLHSVGQAVEAGLQLQREASQESSAESRRKRRRQRLDQLEIPADHVEITDEIIGKGGFGTVYLADYNGLNAAAKVVMFDVDVSEDEDDADAVDDMDAYDRERNNQMRRSASVSAQTAERRQRRAFMRELEAMKRLRGLHTVQIYGAITSFQDRLVMVMELLSGGDLRHRLRKARKPLEDRVLRGIVKDVCAGMAFLHAKKTVHGDLKSANVLFDGTGRAKIADFGTSLWAQHTTRLATYTTKAGQSVGMSLPWAAPEVLNRQGSNFRTDVYSFGMVVWECLTRKIPWADAPGVDMLILAVNGGERPPIPAQTPPDLKSLTESCWHQNPAVRPTFRQIIAGLNENNVSESKSTDNTVVKGNTTSEEGSGGGVGGMVEGDAGDGDRPVERVGTLGAVDNDKADDVVDTTTATFIATASTRELSALTDGSPTVDPVGVQDRSTQRKKVGSDTAQGRGNIIGKRTESGGISRKRSVKASINSVVDAEKTMDSRRQKIKEKEGDDDERPPPPPPYRLSVS